MIYFPKYIKRLSGFALSLLFAIISLNSSAQLIISGYVDGTRNNKGVEIYNPTSDPISLNGWSLRKMVNGTEGNWVTFDLLGTLNAWETYIVAHSDADAQLLLRADALTYSVVSFNGDDPIALFYNNTKIDQIGIAGGVNFASRVTYIRKNGSITPFPNGIDPRSTTDWVQYPTNWVEGIGISSSQPISTGNYNYLKIRRPTCPTSTALDIDQLPLGLTGSTIIYYDDLGRENQVISISQSPTGKDIVQPIDYDEMGLQTIKHFAYEVPVQARASSYRSQWISEKQQFYNDLFPGEGGSSFTEIKLDDSPLNRVKSVTGSGNEWQTNEKRIILGEKTNSAGSVKLFKVTNSGNLHYNGTYPASTLHITEVKDEDNRVVQEYKNLQGKTVLKVEGVSTEQESKTYYIYDDFGRLRWVLPPLLIDEANITPDWFLAQNHELAKKFAYYYRFDARGRLIEKQLPGTEPIFLVYDEANRVVLSQDGVQRSSKKWTTFIYDKLGRLIKSGIVKSPVLTIPTSQEDVQAWFDANPNGLNSLFSNGELLVERFYDFYPSILPSSILSHVRCTILGEAMPDKSNRTTGLLTAQQVKVLDGEKMLWEYFYYDEKGRLIQSVAQVFDGSYTRSAFSYSWDGKLIRELWRMEDATSTPFDGIVKDFAYDHAGRSLGYIINKEKASAAVVPADRLSVVKNSFNKLGMLKSEVLGLTRENGKPQQVDYSYNIRGWLTGINNPDNMGSDLFALTLRYNNPTGVSYRQWGGNISEMEWRTTPHPEDPSGVKHRYRFTYDKFNRLENAYYAHFSSTGGTVYASGRYNEFLNYDKQGNITSLTRWMRNGTSRETLDELSYSYNGNQLYSVGQMANYFTDQRYPIAPVNDNIFEYNENGNLVKEPNRQLLIDYNEISLIKSVTSINNPDRIDNTYDAFGRKLYVTHTNNNIVSTKAYVGPAVYSVVNNALILDYIATPKGRLVKLESGLEMEYHIKDHLGNVRVAFSVGSNGQAITKQVNTYYPFGKQIGNMSYQVGSENRLKYNGKELQEFALNGIKLDWYDYGARFYDPTLGRWHAADPLSELGRSLSPYNYAFNNPTRFIDPTGMWSEDYDEYNTNDPGPDDPPVQPPVAMPSSPELHYNLESVTVSGTKPEIREMWNFDFTGPDYWHDDRPEYVDRKPFSPLETHLQYPTVIQSITNNNPSGQASSQGGDGNGSVWAGALAATAVIAADDVTGIGVADDVVIPFIWAGAAAVVTYRYMTKTTAQYALVAKSGGDYPVYAWGAKDPVSYVHLNAGDIWKYGITTQYVPGTNNQWRYSQTQLSRWNVEWVRQYEGPRTGALYYENARLVNYYNYYGTLPPGNKMFR